MTEFFLPYAEFRVPGGAVTRVTAGGLIGRSSSADLQIDDPTVSEIHAMVSVRGRRLKLLSLRRDVVVAGAPQKTIILQPGLRIRMSSRVELEVVEVQLPSNVLALVGIDARPIELSASVASIVPGANAGQLSFVRRYQQGALAHIWSNSDGIKIQIGSAEPETLRAGMSWKIGTRRVSVEERSGLAGCETTLQSTNQGVESLRPYRALRNSPYIPRRFTPTARDQRSPRERDQPPHLV